MEKMDVFGESESIEHAADINLALYTGFPKVIARDEIEGRLVTISDLLNKQAGVEIKNTAGFGGFNTLSIRGSQSKQVNIHLDGMLLNSPSSGFADLGSIPSVLVERIVVYPSITPIQLGSGNLAGAININTRELNNNQGGQLSLSAASFATYAAEFAYWHGSDSFEWLFSSNRVEAENRYPVDKTLFRTASSSSVRLNAGFEQNNVFLKAKKIGSVVTMHGLLQWVQTDRELPTLANSPKDNATREDNALRSQFLWDYSLANFLLAHHLFFLQDTAELKDFDKTVGSFGTDGRHVKSKLNSYGSKNSATYQGDTHQLAMTLEVKQEDFTKQDLIANKTQLTANRQSIYWAIADDFERFGMQFNAQIKLSHTIEKADQHSIYVPKKQLNNNQVSMQFGAIKPITTWLKINTSLGRNTRMPTMEEKYSSLGDYEGNPDLKNEQIDFIELGFTLNYGALIWQSSLFHQRLTEGIFNQSIGRVIKPTNYGAAIIQGVESDLTLNLPYNTQITLRNSLLDTNNQVEQTVLNGKKLPGLYHQSHYIAVNWLYRFLTFEINYAYATELYYTATNQSNRYEKNNVSERKSLNFSIGLNTERFRIHLAADNLLNTHFIDMAKAPTPARSFSSTLTYNF